jgi:hypothetical protein
MAVSDEFRQFAEECLRWAREAKTEVKRDALLTMARTWIHVAARIDLINGVKRRSDAPPR